MSQVTGLLFGCYDALTDKRLINRLRYLGDKFNIPVACCDDFGHGDNHAILPIGAEAELDTEEHTLKYGGFE